ncbi:hypothetical protein IKF74_01385 [Candidatus Saccharibacteria bacterium]|nr:hypothetical protein [Candidatus Saccharibacteria bacterium]
MKSFRITKIVALALGVFASFGFAKTTFADEPKLGIQISPTVQHITLDPGAHYEGELTIVNIGQTDLEYTMSVKPYQVSGEDYVALFDVHNGYTQITNWISFPENYGNVAPGEVKNVAYVIDVPLDAPGGGQFAALFAETNDAGKSVKYNANVGAVLIAHINGETREEGKILETNIPGFILNPPVTATVRLENKGNIDEEAKSTVEIKNYFSGEVIYEDVTPQTNTLLPGTTRTLTFVVNDVPRLGVLKASLTTEYMNDAEITTRTIFVCPLWFIAIIALIILTIVARIVAKKRDDRRTRANSRNNQGSAEKFNI